MRLLISALAATLVCGCASRPIPDQMSEEQRALNICLWVENQPGWTFLPSPPPIAEELRTAIVASSPRPLPELRDYEFWFSHADGRYMRCTNPMGGAYESEGIPAVCGASTHTFSRAGDSWSIEESPLMFCHRHR